LYCQVDRFTPKVYNESVSLEFAIIVSVELDSGFPAVDLFGNDTAFRENVVDFIDRSIKRNRRNVDGSIDSCFLRLSLTVLLIDMFS